MTRLQFAHMNDADGFGYLNHAAISFALAGDNVLISGITQQRIYVYRIFIVVGGNTDITFKDGLFTSLTGAMPMLANGALAFDLSNVPWFQTSSGNDFILNSSASVQVSGAIYYRQDE